MTAKELLEILEVLASAGVTAAEVPVSGGTLKLTFAMAEPAEPARAPDEDLPWNARDPDAEIARANFEPKKSA